MQMIPKIMLIALCVIAVFSVSSIYAQTQIPDWVKSSALWYGQDEISDGEFFNMIQFLVDRSIITVPGNPGDSSGRVGDLEESSESGTARDIQSAYDDGYMDGYNAGGSDGYAIGYGHGYIDYQNGGHAGSYVVHVGASLDSSTPGCEKTSQGCFSERAIAIDLGEAVKFGNYDNESHAFVSGSFADGPDGIFDSGVVVPGDSYTWAPVSAGQYDYYCPLYPWMEGTITVN